MKPILLSLLLLPLASCTTTKPVAAASKVEAPARGGRHHRHKAGKEAGAAASTAAAVKPYPLKTCLVTGDKFDPTDEIVTTTYKGQEIKLCCRDCLKKFKKDPEKYMAKLN